MTNDGGFQAVDYAPIMVTGGNQPPTLTLTDPASIVSVNVSATQAFGVTTGDPEGR